MNDDFKISHYLTIKIVGHVSVTLEDTSWCSWEQSFQLSTIPRSSLFCNVSTKISILWGDSLKNLLFFVANFSHQLIWEIKLFIFFKFGVELQLSVSQIQKEIQPDRFKAVLLYPDITTQTTKELHELQITQHIFSTDKSATTGDLSYVLLIT